MTDALSPLDPEVKRKFEGVGTATIATALFKRGLRNQFVQGVRRLQAGAKVMVGPAFTLRYIPAREDLDVVAAFRDPQHPQRLAVETVPAGHVLIMDCRRDASAASAGAILATRLQVRGCAGLVTDGGLRDVEEIAELALPAYCAAPSAPTNLTKHHAVDINLPIGCGSTPVYPGDIVVGDADGVIVVPGRSPPSSPTRSPSRRPSRSSSSAWSRAGRCRAPIRRTRRRWPATARASRPARRPSLPISSRMDARDRQ